MKHSDALKKVRETQAAVQAARAERERQNSADAATLIVALARATEQRGLAAAALTRLIERGETVITVAGLAGVTEQELTALTDQPQRPRSKKAARVNGHSANGDGKNKDADESWGLLNPAGDPAASNPSVINR